MKKLISATICCIVFVGCSDPRKTPLPDDFTKMEAIKPQLEKLSIEDKELLAGYVMRKSLKGTMFSALANSETMTAKNLGEAIDAQRKFVVAAKVREATEKAEMSKLLAEREVAEKAMRELVSVGLAGKKIEVERGSSGMELDRKLVVSFVFKNNSGKQISGVKGRITIRDLFGDEISAFQISNDETMKVGGGTIWEGNRSVKYTFGSNKDEKFADLADDKFTLVWQPQVIVFADGTKVETPNAR